MNKENPLDELGMSNHKMNMPEGWSDSHEDDYMKDLRRRKRKENIAVFILYAIVFIFLVWVVVQA